MWFEVTKTNIKYIIGGLYRHPNQNIKVFTDLFDVRVLNKRNKRKTPCIVAGDVNIDLIKNESNKNISDYLNILVANNFLPVLLMPTRITQTSATLIDHIYYYQGSNSKLDWKSTSGSLFSDLSDHLSHFVNLSNNVKKKQISNRPMIRL